MSNKDTIVDVPTVNKIARLCRLDIPEVNKVEGVDDPNYNNPYYSSMDSNIEMMMGMDKDGDN